MLGLVLCKLSDMPDDDVAAEFGGDLVRLARLRNAADAQGQPLAAYIRDAICRFLEQAPEDDWATAIGRMQTDEAPGDRLIDLAIEQQLLRDGA